MGLRVVLAAAMLAVVAGCGGGAATGGAALNGDSVRNSLHLNVWDETYGSGATADSFSQWVTEDNGFITLDVNVTRAASLRDLYFDVEYDRVRLIPTGVDFTDRIALPNQRDEQVDLTTPGLLKASEVSSSIAALGFTGSGRLARVHFKLR